MSKDFYIKATAPHPLGYYGAWQDTTTQSAAASNTGYAMKFNTVDLSNGVSVVTNGSDLTRITFANTGIYNLQFSAQFQNSSALDEDVTIWLRMNGVDVAGSSGFVAVIAKHAGTDGHVIVSWNYLLDVVAGQYYELIWSTTNHTSITMQFYAAGSPPPSAASVIATVTQQAGILAGSGMTALNGLTGTAQTFATGTSGTDFAINSAGTTHTFNVPIASAVNTGKLSASDWSTFNAKEPAITAGTTLQYFRGDKTFQTLPIKNIQSTTDGTAITGTTLSTATSSLLIPANTIGVGDVLNFKTRLRKTGTAGTTIIRVYFNTSPVIGGSLVAASTTAASTSLFVQMSRTFAVKSATNTESYPSGIGATIDEGITGTAVTASNIDWTVAQYLVIAIQNSNIGDSSRSSFVNLQINKA